ncbi:MAG TPA: hypothetical protein PKV15_00345 [Syntrophomonadaceae bacterium]|jgi:hypothetical protein|nr:hypothetical protein [Syntrophomonadaceae bacterium]HRX20137.1 hypothetical protein [Syntrophomonadaceae bacterium]
MNLTITKQGLKLICKVKDLEKLFCDWPGEMTLSDFIFLHTH